MRVILFEEEAAKISSENEPKQPVPLSHFYVRNVNVRYRPFWLYKTMLISRHMHGHLEQSKHKLIFPRWNIAILRVLANLIRRYIVNLITVLPRTKHHVFSSTGTGRN